MQALVRYWRESGYPHTFRVMLIVASGTAIVVAWVLLFLQVEPVPTWFYVFAWYPTLVLLDAIGSRLDGRKTMLWRRPMIIVFLWSPVVWFVFEAANFRLSNWYYVFLPSAAWERWCGIVLSFATVVPAVLLAERLLDAIGLFRRGRGPVVSIRRWELSSAVVAGVMMGALLLFYPTIFFPLIWGSLFLLIDPLVYRVQPSLSLLGDLERGYWGRIGRLMLGGLGIGLIWESFNFWARGKWIYTVPWLEELKIFEMPPFGFVGFPVFTLEAWSMYAALCVLGVAVPMAGNASIKAGRLAVGLVLGIVFSAVTLLGMEHRTISSTVPVLSEIPGIAPEFVQALGDAGISSVADLARASPTVLATRAELTPNAVEAAVERAQLIQMRGLGTVHARTLLGLGIETVCELSNRDPDTLFDRIDRERTGPRPTAAEVSVWVRAAERRCARRLD